MPLRASSADKMHDFRRGPGVKRRIVVLGEVNSGKTSLVNAIADAEVLTPSSLSHTRHPTSLHFCAKPFVAVENFQRQRARVSAVGEVPEDGVRRVYVGSPSPALREMTVIDTPGLGAIDEDADPRTIALCRTAHLAIWCTPAMQAWKASEEECWRSLPPRVQARGLLAVTFAETVPAGDLERLMARLERDAGPLFRWIALAGECAEIARTAPLR